MDILLLAAYVILFFLLAVMTLAIALWIIPVRSAIRIISTEEEFRDIITIAWGFFGVIIHHDHDGMDAELQAFRWTFARFSRLPHGETKKLPPEELPARAPELSPGVTTEFAGKLVRPFSSLGSVFWRESRFEGAEGRITLGLGDPAVTGLFFGYYWAARFLLEAARIQIEIEPVFDRDIFSCDLEIRMCITHPLHLIISMLPILEAPGIRDLVAAARAGHPGAGAS